MWRLVLALAAGLCLARPVAAQEISRTAGQSDTEIAVKFVHLTEEGGYSGTPGLLVDGGYRVWIYRGWRISGIGELMLVDFYDFDSVYKQVAVGARAGRQFTPQVRAFGQLQMGVQNDGLEESNTGFVMLPGVGVNYAVSRRFDMQVTADFPVVRYSDRWFNQFRLAIGLAMPLGQ